MDIYLIIYLLLIALSLYSLSIISYIYYWLQVYLRFSDFLRLQYVSASYKFFSCRGERATPLEVSIARLCRSQNQYWISSTSHFSLKFRSWKSGLSTFLKCKNENLVIQNFKKDCIKPLQNYKISTVKSCQCIILSYSCLTLHIIEDQEN